MKDATLTVAVAPVLVFASIGKSLLIAYIAMQTVWLLQSLNLLILVTLS